MRISKAVEKALDETGQPWEIKRGSRHLKIIVGGQFAGILPHDGLGSSNVRAERNTIAQIKRAARGVKP